MTSLLAALTLAAGSSAHAETIVFSDISFGTSLTVLRPDGRSFTAPVGALDITVDGETDEAWCVDLDTSLWYGANFSASLEPAPAESPWCEINALLSDLSIEDDTTGAAVQLAIWKLLEPGLTTTNATVEALANALLAEVEGACPLTCQDEATFDAKVLNSSSGKVYIDLVVGRDGGAPVSGEAVQIELSAGSLVEPADGLAFTDANGLVSLVIDPQGNRQVTIDVEIDGSTVYRIVPDITVQSLAFLGEECLFEDSVEWQAAALGDPRTIGFWKHQLAVATGKTRGSGHVSTATLSGWLPVTTFGQTFWTLPELYNILWLGKATMAQRAIQQCTATQLNVLWGEADWFSPLDMNGDGTTDMQLWQLWQEAEAAYAARNYELAKDLCDTFNNL